MNLGMIERQSTVISHKSVLPVDQISFARDVAVALVKEYSELVWRLTSPKLSPMATEFAYGRLLGVRGSLCRICPPAYLALLTNETIDTWRIAESRLYNYFDSCSTNETLSGVARNVEERWSSCVESFLNVMAGKVLSGEIRDQIGLLRGIDSIALHLAQREIFHWSDYFNVPPGNAQAVKIRIRLFSLFLATQRIDFGSSFKAIQSYRETFGILDRQAYPWWFVDTALTEKQMNWTYRRLSNEDLGWRFNHGSQIWNGCIRV